VNSDRKVIRLHAMIPIAVATAANSFRHRFESSVKSEDEFSLAKSVTTIGIIVTDYCAAACAHCYNSSGPKGRNFLDQAQIVRFISWWRQSYSHPMTLSISGGEPFAHPDLLNIIACAKDHGFTTAITTGAVGITPQDLLNASRAGADSITFSWDKYHSKFIEWDRFVSLVLTAETVFANVQVNFVFESEEDRIAGESKLAGDLPTVGIVVAPVAPFGRAKALFRKTGDTPYVDSAGNCAREFETLTVNFDGQVYPCCSLGGFSPGLSMGYISNVTGTGSPESLYSSNPLVPWLATTGWSQTTEDKCVNCSKSAIQQLSSLKKLGTPRSSD
jgi:Radical SAM superfamily/4Fe-4S single cluster domain